MKSKIRNMIYAISAVLLMAIGSPSVNAASYVFSQGGFPDGGFVTGSFEGEDKVGFTQPINSYISNGPDGTITDCFGRGCVPTLIDGVTSFSIHFSGNSLFESINNTRGSYLNYLSYEISTNSLSIFYGACGNCTPYWMYNGRAGEIYPGELVPGVMSSNGFVYYPTLETTEPLLVSQVPLPGALGFFISGLTWLGLIRRKGKELILINSAIDGDVGGG